MITLALVLLPLWGAIDAALKPDSRWQAADQSKVTWVLLQLLGILGLGIVGLIAAAIYFWRIRPQLTRFDRAAA